MYSATLFICLLLMIGVSTDDEHCLRRGGRCTLKSDCKEPITETGVCEARYTECCYDGEHPRCTSLGGECINNCPVTVTRNEAKDCAPGLACCVWLY